MGIDVELHIKTSDGQPPKTCDDCIAHIGELLNSSDVPGANYQIYSLCRYYGKGYERGNWPMISATIMSLFAATNVEKIWYFGDCDDEESVNPFTVDDLCDLNRHYCAVGDRPYRGT